MANIERHATGSVILGLSSVRRLTVDENGKLDNYQVVNHLIAGREIRAMSQVCGTTCSEVKRLT